MNHDKFETINPHRLHDLARLEAERLRIEAMRSFGNEMVDDFWRAANAVWQRNQATTQRSAARLQARLARRAKSRLAASTTGV